MRRAVYRLRWAVYRLCWAVYRLRWATVCTLAAHVPNQWPVSAHTRQRHSVRINCRSLNRRCCAHLPRTHRCAQFLKCVIVTRAHVPRQGASLTPPLGVARTFDMHRYPMSLTSLECHASELVHSDACPRPTTAAHREASCRAGRRAPRAAEGCRWGPSAPRVEVDLCPGAPKC